MVMATPPRKNISVTVTRYRMAMRLWSLVSSQDSHAVGRR